MLERLLQMTAYLLPSCQSRANKQYIYTDSKNKQYTNKIEDYCTCILELRVENVLEMKSMKIHSTRPLSQMFISSVHKYSSLNLTLNDPLKLFFVLKEKLF